MNDSARRFGPTHYFAPEADAEGYLSTIIQNINKSASDGTIQALYDSQFLATVSST
jgi:hypothetical protein